MKRALRSHWPEYLMEAAELGLFMLSASLFAALLELPSSPVRAALPDAFGRRVLMGVAMGATAVAIIKSPLGQQSGAHFNPAVTTTFFRLGKVTGADAVFYVLAQFTGAVLGMLFARLVLGMLLGHPAVGYVATVPGEAGPLVALGAEALISFVLMSVVLLVGSDARFARYTPYFAGTLVAAYIALEAPISGMSMNPARTFGSAAVAGAFPSFWVYVLGPLAGMLAAAEVHVRVKGVSSVLCAKLDHFNDRRCIFCGANGGSL
ncbi:MAG TPA: aquaporin [Thermoanaerobaculia bacterium]|nr:aquaporin [Thermoanaerobaculia bacterium]